MTLDPWPALDRAHRSAGLEEAEIDRGVGALLGLAVGDALGTTLEFARRDTRPHHTEMLGGGPFGLQGGQWTDDTAMALALAESLLTCGGLNAGDLMRRFVEWWRKGTYSCTGTCFDIGITTREALARFERTGDPFSGSPDEAKAGNGSLMRLAPVVLAAYPDRERALDWAQGQSRTTHATPQAVNACAFFSVLLLEAGAASAEVTAAVSRAITADPDNGPPLAAAPNFQAATAAVRPAGSPAS